VAACGLVAAVVPILGAPAAHADTGSLIISEVGSARPSER